MTFWWWVLVFGAIALAALILFGWIGLQLWRKAKVLLAELAHLSTVTAAMETAMAPAGSRAEPAWVPDPVAIGRHRSE